MPRLVDLMLVAMSLSAAVVFTTQAQEQTLQRITRAESRIILTIPDLQGGEEYYGYAGWDAQFERESWIGMAMARGSRYPHSMVLLQSLGPTYAWHDPEPVNMDVLKSISPMLREKEITIFPDTAVPKIDHLARTIRFAVDSADCLGFSVLGGVPGPKGDAGADGVIGYYCSAAGAKLSQADIRVILAGWKVLPKK